MSKSREAELQVVIESQEQEILRLRQALKMATKNQKRDISVAQKLAVQKATRVRIAKSKKKIEDAVNILRLEGRNITLSSVADVSKCSPNTIRKYKDFIESQKIL